MFQKIKKHPLAGLILLVAGVLICSLSVAGYAAGPDTLDIVKLLGKGNPASTLLGGKDGRQPGAGSTDEDVRVQEQLVALKKKRHELSKIEIEYQKRLERESSFGQPKMSSRHAISVENMFGDEPVVSLDMQDPLATQPINNSQLGLSERDQGKIDQGGNAGLPDRAVLQSETAGQLGGGMGLQNTLSKADAAQPSSKRTVMKQKYVRLLLMKRTIEKQLSDLATIKTDTKPGSKEEPEDKDLKDLRLKLQKQLVAVTNLESQYNENDFIDLNDEVSKTIRNTLSHDPVAEKVRRTSKPISVSNSIFQFGYKFFEGVNQPPSSFEMFSVNDYVVGPGDELRIFFYGSVREEKDIAVERDGTINLLNDAPISVGGLTFAEMNAKLQNLIKEKMIGISAKITISNYRSMRVFILGDVSIPGPCTVRGMSTVSGALLTCGGVDKAGSLRKISVIRNGKKIGVFDLYDFLLKGDTSRDPILKAGDAIFVSSIQNTAAVAGEVNRPAIYEFNESLTLDELVNTAGGLRPTSLAQMAQVERIDKQGNITTIDVDLAGSTRKMAIQNGDILKIFSLVPDSLDANAVFFVGNVRNAGKRAFVPGMKVADLLENGKAFMKDTYLEYGIIERENGFGRETEVLHFNPGKALIGKEDDNLTLMPQDKVYLFNTEEFIEPNVVQVEGLVNTPGKYSMKKNMTVLDVILAAGGLRDEADLSFAELYRENPVSKAVTLLRLNLEETISSRGEANNPVLQNNDRVVIHSVRERHTISTVGVTGEIRTPGSYPLPADARLLDLIYAAGGLTEKAYKKKVEITRYEVRDGMEMESTHFEADIEAALHGSLKDNVLLQKNDQVIIRPISNWGDTAYVKLEGEIMFPGNYIIQKGESLSSVIKRAGGFTDGAFVYGLRFSRVSIAAMQKKQYVDMADRLDQETSHLALTPSQIGADKAAGAKEMMIAGLKAMADKLRKTEGTGRLVVNVPSDVAKMSKDEDLELENGDTIHVPKKPVAILVMGAVYNQNAFQYFSSSSVESYINMAGGYTERANPEGTSIIKANGEVMPLRGGYFQKKASLGPGDVIMVPETVTQYSNLQMTQDITTILYQLSLTAAGLKTIGVFQ